MGRLFGGWGFNDLLSPPQTPSPTASVRSNTSEKSAPVKINNQVIYVTQDLQKAVSDGADRVRSNWLTALNLKKELILNPDVLIPLLNHAKLYWHDWLNRQRCEISASERIEKIFINNKNLSKEESDWVAETIVDYKRMVKCALAQNAPRPITPPPSIISLPLNKKCPYNIL